MCLLQALSEAHCATLKSEELSTLQPASIAPFEGFNILEYTQQGFRVT